MARSMRIAIVHEWFTSMRGGEKCVEALCEVFPDATVYALLHVKGSVSPIIERMPMHTSFVQHLPFAATWYRYYLPLFPTAVRRFDLSGFDVVISSNHCAAKGVRTAPHTLHICYCYTPMRYIWTQYGDYFGARRSGLLARWGMRAAVGYLRRWDLRTAKNPHYFIAISENIRKRIRTIYGRESDVIYPPVGTAALSVVREHEDFDLIVSALVPYKRVDIAVEAYNRMGRCLVVIGDGPDLFRLRQMAGPTVQMLGWRPDDDVRDHFRRCRAVVFPGEEDFGIVPVEAIACGKPVVAYARGGALETVLEGPALKTGVLFQEQTAESLSAAVRKLEAESFDTIAMHAFALGFDREIYKLKMKEYILKRWEGFQAGSPQPQVVKHVSSTRR
jgi:glycosyltransferase involved in cell wall biosynthesis